MKSILLYIYKQSTEKYKKQVCLFTDMLKQAVYSGNKEQDLQLQIDAVRKYFYFQTKA